MLNVLARILGSGEVIKQGFELIDNMHTSEAEEIAAKAQARTAFLGAYAPFKVAQRYLALMFAFTFLASFVLVLGMTLGGVAEIDPVRDVISEFYLGEIMLTIVAFYFAGGMAEGIISKKKRRTMSTRHVIQHSFSGGEVSPKMLMRQDLQAYNEACLGMLNMQPTMTGSVERCPGTHFLQEIAADKARIMPYLTRANERSLALFTHNNVKLLTNISRLLTPNYVPGDEDGVTIFRKQIVENSDFNGGADPWILDGGEISSGTGKVGIWTSAGILVMRPSNYKDAHPRTVSAINTCTVDVATNIITIVYNITYASAIPIDTNYKFEIVVAAGSEELYRTSFDNAEVGTTWDRQINVKLPSDDWTGDIKITLTAEAIGGDPENAVPRFHVDQFGVWANGEAVLEEVDLATPFDNQDLVDLHYVQSPYEDKELVVVHPRHPPQKLYFDTTAGQYKFEAISFSNEPAQWVNNNYPASCSAYQGRLVLAGGRLESKAGDPLTSATETVWCTEVGKWNTFTLDEVNPDDSVEFTTTFRSPIQWVHGHKSLLVGSLEMEYVASGEGIYSPGDLGVNLHSTHGSANVQPAGYGEGIIFAADGGRRAREMGYDNDIKGWVARDLTILHPELCNAGVRRMVRVRNPHQMCIVLLKDGEMAVYHAEQGAQGWSRINVNGADVKDIAVVSDENGIDIPYIVVRRSINGTNKTYLEAFPNWVNGRTWDYLSSAIQFLNATPDSTIRGLEHLEGKTVQVMADRAYLGYYTVEDGKIDLIDGAGQPITPNYVLVGLNMPCSLLTLPPAKVDPGSPARFSNYSVRVLGSTIPIINGERPSDRKPLSAMDKSEPLEWFADCKVAKTGWDAYQSILIEENTPLRCEILGVYGRLTANSL